MIERKRVTQTAEELAKEFGLANLSLAMMCGALDIPNGTFMHHTGISFSELVETLDKDAPIITGHAVTARRISPAFRRRQILAVAVELSEKFGYMTITREQVATESGVSPALITKYYGAIDLLQEEVIDHAIRIENLPIIAQCLSVWDKRVLSAPEELKERAARYLMSGGRK